MQSQSPKNRLPIASRKRATPARMCVRQMAGPSHKEAMPVDHGIACDPTREADNGTAPKTQSRPYRAKCPRLRVNQLRGLLERFLHLPDHEQEKNSRPRQSPPGACNGRGLYPAIVKHRFRHWFNQG